MNVSPGRLATASALALLCFSPAIPGGRQFPAASEILGRAEEVRSPDLDYAVDIKLLVRDPTTFWKERSASYTMVAHGKDHSFVLMREPKLFYPGTLLIMDNAYWLLHPRADRPLQLSSQQVLGGDISNGDLARGNLLKNYEARLDGEDKVEQDPCWVVELKRANAIASYPRIRYWITKRRPRPRKFEYYGETERLLKTVFYEDYRKGPLGTRSMLIVARTPARADETTTMTFTNLRRIDVSGLTFDLAGLTAFRDAARTGLETGGAQAQPEDLVTRLRGAPVP